MKPYEREALLDRVERESATVGASIPEEVTVEGERVPVRERVLALQRADELTDERRAERDHLLVLLRRKRAALRDELEEAAIDRATGERIVEEIVDIDRARSALRGVGEETDIEAEIREQEVADAERWRSFVKRTRGGFDRSLGR